MRRLALHPLPAHVPRSSWVDATVVVIDVLRATTVIVEALHAGATEVIPCATVTEARQTAAHLGPSALLAGERGGLPISGFDLGNSPRACQPDRVGGRSLIMTTTNGTRALLHAANAPRVLIAAFTNLPAVVRTLAADPRDVHLLCAGTDGQPTEEDLLLAGAIAGELALLKPFQLDADATVWADTWSQTGVPQVHDRLRASTGGRNLISLRFDDDIEHAAQVGLHPGVPEYRPPGRCCLP